MRREIFVVPYCCIGLAAALLAGALGCAVGRAASRAGRGAPAAPATSSQNLEQLARLHAERQAEERAGDYLIGPGDLLAVRAYDLEELNQRVRVDGNGSISLPLLETVPVAGRTVPELQQELTHRLGAFMYDAHVDVAVEEYRSRQVAVLGAVQRPGLISQTTRRATVRDALSAAGGLTSQSGSRIHLIPAESRPMVAAETAGLTGTQDGAPAGEAGVIPDPAAIVIDTKEVSPEVQTTFFDLPVHGGDVIMVPNAGHVILEGWVTKPGRYPLEQGLTLRGAVATAGGLLFPARTNLMRVYRYRPGGGGEMDVLEVNYNDITSQRAPDVFLREGDVLEVSAEPTKLVPYGVFWTISKLVNIGAGIKVVP
jgi:polysaccharide export outer membrane protein